MKIQKRGTTFRNLIPNPLHRNLADIAYKKVKQLAAESAEMYSYSIFYLYLSTYVRNCARLV